MKCIDMELGVRVANGWWLAVVLGIVAACGESRIYHDRVGSGGATAGTGVTAGRTGGGGNSAGSDTAGTNAAPDEKGGRAGTSGGIANSGPAGQPMAGRAGADGGSKGISDAGSTSGGGSASGARGGSASGARGGGASGEGGSENGGEAGQPGATCGNGALDAGEECDLGPINQLNAYGANTCSTHCKRGGYCGDGRRDGPEMCDDGDSTSTELGACNPECTGYFEKKRIRPTNHFYSTNLGGIAGADAICGQEFTSNWRALLVATTRRASVTPNTGDGQIDWVIRKYTHYYNWRDELIWRTDDVPLLGVRNGMRTNVYAKVFDPSSGNYPWSGWDSDWTTFPDGADFEGNCAGWTSSSDGFASFVDDGLMAYASELCGATAFILCVEQ